MILRETETRVVKVSRWGDDEQTLIDPGRILILQPDGTHHPLTPNLGGPAEGWRQDFWVLESHGSHIALLTAGGQKMIVVDTDTGDTHAVPAPGAGFWTPNRLPLVPSSTVLGTSFDVFAIGFRTNDGDWYLHEVRLSDQTVREVGQYDGPPPQSLLPVEARILGGKRRGRQRHAGVYKMAGITRQPLENLPRRP